MTSKKLTPKKKSKSSSPVPKTLDPLIIIDVAGGKLVARVLRHELRNEPDTFVLSYPAQITFPIEVLDAGRRFAIKASLMGLVAVDNVYHLPKSAIRGYTHCDDPWLLDVYARFERRAMAGEFRLNPYTKPETINLMQGNGEVEAEVGDVSVIHAVGAGASDA